MRRSKPMLAATFVTVVALAALASACGSSSKSSTATTTTKPATPFALTVNAGDYAYTGLPDSLPAGLISMKFVNQGQVDHELGFIKVTDDTNPQAVLASLGKVISGEPFPTSFLAANGVPNTPPGKTTDAQFNLTPGQYLAFCSDTGVVGSKADGKPHFTRGMYKKITVTGTGGETAPTAESTLVAHDYSFDVSGLKAGQQTIAFKNDGPVQWHFGEILEFAKGVTVAKAEADVPKLLASQGAPPAGVTPPEPVAASQIASPGYGNTFSANLEAGRVYVVLCFVSDKLGGPPHAIAHKMYKVFTVS